jgi:hypothetical protein
MNLVIRITILALASLGIVSAESRAPVIVELFTSEGCSSCPPADEVLTRLDRDQPVPGVEVIALSEHVDYWDHLGWRDRFSSVLFSQRQEVYGKVFRLDSVYTPQIVVNGQTEVLGSDWGAVNRAIRAASHAPGAAVTMSVKNGDTVSYRISQLPKGIGTTDVVLAVTEDNLETSVAGGENGGRRLRHTGVVRSLTTAGHLDAKNESYSGETRLQLNPQWNRANLKLVLFVQDRDTRHVLGAAAIHP